VTCKITNAGREMRPEDLNGAKMVFSVAQATIHSTGGTFSGWWWHQGTEYVPGEDIYGPFKTEKAARNNAMQNCTPMN
jgi:hypothetical protein